MEHVGVTTDPLFNTKQSGVCGVKATACIHCPAAARLQQTMAGFPGGRVAKSQPYKCALSVESLVGASVEVAPEAKTAERTGQSGTGPDWAHPLMACFVKVNDFQLQ